MVNTMVSNYLKIVHASKKRDPKTLEGFKKNLLPEKYLPHYLAFIDHMTDETVLNMAKSALGGHYPENVVSTAQVMFLYGTKANDMAAAKVAKRFQKDYPQAIVVCRKGNAHIENAAFYPEKWYAEIQEFLDLNEKA